VRCGDGGTANDPSPTPPRGTQTRLRASWPEAPSSGSWPSPALATGCSNLGHSGLALTTMSSGIATGAECGQRDGWWSYRSTWKPVPIPLQRAVGLCGHNP